MGDRADPQALPVIGKRVRRREVVESLPVSIDHPQWTVAWASRGVSSLVPSSSPGAHEVGVRTAAAPWGRHDACTNRASAAYPPSMLSVGRRTDDQSAGGWRAGTVAGSTTAVTTDSVTVDTARPSGHPRIRTSFS